MGAERRDVYKRQAWHSEQCLNGFPLFSACPDGLTKRLQETVGVCVQRHAFINITLDVCCLRTIYTFACVCKNNDNNGFSTTYGNKLP